MEFIIVTGLSGAGKSRAIEVMEDIGFYCVDNVPPAMIAKFAELCFGTGSKMDKVAIVTDVRGGDLFDSLTENLAALTSSGWEYKILFLDASDAALVKRYKETRRKHPLCSSPDIGIIDAITKERQILKKVRDRADYVIDTTTLNSNQLKEKITEMFGGAGKRTGFIINVLSFGFKYGLPIESDLVFDVRFLPNPFYIDGLREHTGLDAEVYDYVMKWEQTRSFKDKLTDMLAFLIPYYIEEGKSSLVISIGCTGGRHRSVSIAKAIAEELKSSSYYVTLSHRDIYKDSAAQQR